MPIPKELKILYRILTWSALAVLVPVLILILKKSPAPNVQVDPTAVARVDRKFAAADQAKAAGQPAQVQLDSTELNSYLAQNLQLEGSAAANASGASVPAPSSDSGASANQSSNAMPNLDSSADAASIESVQSTVKDVKVDMDGDLVKAYVVFDYHGKDLSLELDGHLGTENGYLKFIPVSGKLGSLPLPQSTLNAAVDKMMSSPENREKLKLPDGVSDIQIQQGQAVVSYK